MEMVISDFENGRLKNVCDHPGDFPDTRLIGCARGLRPNRRRRGRGA